MKSYLNYSVFHQLSATEGPVKIRLNISWNKHKESHVDKKYIKQKYYVNTVYTFVCIWWKMNNFKLQTDTTRQYNVYVSFICKRNFCFQKHIHFFKIYNYYSIGLLVLAFLVGLISAGITIKSMIEEYTEHLLLLLISDFSSLVFNLSEYFLLNQILIFCWMQWPKPHV